MFLGCELTRRMDRYCAPQTGSAALCIDRFKFTLRETKQAVLGQISSDTRPHRPVGSGFGDMGTGLGFKRKMADFGRKFSMENSLGMNTCYVCVRACVLIGQPQQQGILISPATNARCYNYDSTSIRRSFDDRSTAYQRSLMSQ